MSNKMESPEGGEAIIPIAFPPPRSKASGKSTIMNGR